MKLVTHEMSKRFNEFGTTTQCLYEESSELRPNYSNVGTDYHVEFDVTVDVAVDDTEVFVNQIKSHQSFVLVECLWTMVGYNLSSADKTIASIHLKGVPYENLEQD